MRRPKALLTTGRLPVSLDLARTLYAGGYNVHAADSLPFHICQSSRAVEKTTRTRPPQSDPQGFRQDLLNLVAQENPDLVIPTCEEAIYLADLRGELPPQCTAVVDSFETLLTFHSKWKFPNLARNFGLEAPATIYWHPSDPHPCDTLDVDIAVLKPEFSRGGHSVHFVQRNQPLPLLKPLESGNSWVAQAAVAGPTLCSFSLAFEGRLATNVFYRPVVTLGNVGVSFHRLDNPLALRWVETFIESTKYNGFISFDFIEGNSGPSAIECNPRITSGLHLAPPAELWRGINLFLGGKTPLPAPRTKLSSRRPERASMGIGVLSALPKVLHNPSTCGSKLKHILRSKEVIFSPRDPLPSLYQFGCLSYSLWLKRSHRLNILETTTWDIEWNHEHTPPPQNLVGDSRFGTSAS